MIEHGFPREVSACGWSGDLTSASQTIVLDDIGDWSGHQNMKILFDLVDFFGTKPEDVKWETDSYDEYGITELHLHFSKVDLTRFNKK